MDNKNQKKYFPMLAGGNSFEDYEKLRSLPKKIQGILLSEKITDFIYGASQRYNLDDTKTEEFSRTVRQYFFNEIQDGQFARKIAELCNTSNESGLEILNSIKNIRPESEVKPKRNLVTGQAYTPTQSINFSNNFPTNNRGVSSTQSRAKQSIKPQNRLSSTTPQTSNIVQVPIRKALKLYPKLESQTLTKSPIVSKPFLKPVKPTIKNWLTIYEELMGVSKKGAMERGNFLFHSEATKNLPTDERQKLAQVLKSADDSSNLKIDTTNGDIIFTILAIEKKLPVNKSVEKSFSQQTNPVKNTIPSQQSSSNILSQDKKNDSIDQNQKQSSVSPTSDFKQKENKENFQFQKNGFGSLQKGDGLNNFASKLVNENAGDMGSEDFNIAQQKNKSLSSSDNSEENISFTSRHILPKEKQE